MSFKIFVFCAVVVAVNAGGYLPVQPVAPVVQYAVAAPVASVYEQRGASFGSTIRSDSFTAPAVQYTQVQPIVKPIITPVVSKVTYAAPTVAYAAPTVAYAAAPLALGHGAGLGFGLNGGYLGGHGGLGYSGGCLGGACGGLW